MLRASQGAHPQAMSEEFPRDHVYPRERVVDMETTIGVGTCGSVKDVLVDGRLKACTKVRMRVTWCMVRLGLYPGAC